MPDTKAPPQALPVVTFDHQLSVHLNGEEIRACTSPPATPTATWSCTSPARTSCTWATTSSTAASRSSTWSTAARCRATSRRRRMLAPLPAGAKIIPGHGPLGTRTDLEKYLAMLKETTAIVQKAIDEGRTVDQIVAAKPFARWEANPAIVTSEFYTRILYNGLKGIAKNPRSPDAGSASGAHHARPALARREDPVRQRTCIPGRCGTRTATRRQAPS